MEFITERKMRKAAKRRAARKTKHAHLLDRYALPDGRLVMKARTDSGRIIDIRVRPGDGDRAADIWGGMLVPYVYRGGRAYYAPDESTDNPEPHA